MVLVITVIAKVEFFSQTEEFSRIGRDFNTVVTDRMLALNLLTGIDYNVDNETWVNLIVFKQNILVSEYLRILFLLI